MALDALYARKDKLFTEIEKHLATKLGFDFANLNADQKSDIAAEAEELTENWDMAEIEGKPANNSEMSVLLKEHYEVCEQIIDIRDRDLNRDDDGLDLDD